MAFDADRFTDALMLGTKMLIAKALEPLKAENAALLARHSALESRLEAIEVRDVAAELRPHIDAVARAVDALPGVPDLSSFATKDDLAELARAIPEIPAAPEIDLSGFAAKAELAALLETIEAIPAAPDLAGFATKADLADAVAAIPEPADLSGFATKADLQELRGDIPAPPDLSGFATKNDLSEVAKAIPELPEPHDLSGFATKDDVVALRREIPASPDLSGLATKADLEALPSPAPGKDADMGEVARLIGEEVAKAIAELPPTKDGEPGADADMTEILRHVEATVAAAIPPKEDLRGPAGRLPTVKAWVDAVHYEGAVVAHDGSLYQASVDTGREPPHVDWTCLAARGEDGRSVNVRGTYVDGGEYRYLDITALNGGSFIALRDDPGACPGEGWQLLAGRGKPGQSIKGDPGPKGDDAPLIVAAHVSDEGVLTIISADGTEAKADFYPLLSKMAPR